jgi:dTDP-4-amino-4,6-dideoxygalactose transaminase
MYNGGVEFDCSKSKKLEKRTVSLPMNERLSVAEKQFIIDNVKESM